MGNSTSIRIPDAVTSSQAAVVLKEMFANPDFVRKQLNPQPGEPGYLHRSDFLLALKRDATHEKIAILDYGAGLSPFRSWFPNSDYRRADIVDFADPDYLIGADGTVPEESAMFDMVLSTQVLSFVTDPHKYLSECFRLLKPGGKLILSTGSLLAVSNSPIDFQRWMVDGLKRDLTKAGFENINVYKLSTGPRAVMYFIERYVYTMVPPERLSQDCYIGLIRACFDIFVAGFISEWIDITLRIGLSRLMFLTTIFTLLYLPVPSSVVKFQRCAKLLIFTDQAPPFVFLVFRNQVD